MRAFILLAAGAALGLVGAWLTLGGGSGGEAGGRAVAADPVIPQLSAYQSAGRKLFNDNCAACHGENATGTDQGPPFLNPIYKPSHHGDMSFYMAAQRGVRAHHWRFGDMPAQTQITQEEVRPIIAYVRALQRANGID
ncbi:cytochrome c [Breoghania sp. JC706]|uniref:c-type cytochrome n=1 Tax=Breoghania sp. JC706 TaxID=3117732 RepID=UPI0030084958